MEHIAKLVESGKVTGVSDVRDESDRNGMRIVVEVKRGGSWHRIKPLPHCVARLMPFIA